MDKEEFNQPEINSIPEFKSYRAEFFGVPEHSRPKMEEYKLPEIANSSLPEKPIQENKEDGYSEKLRKNAQNTGHTSGSSSGDAGFNAAGGGGGGAGISSAATTATSGAAGAGSSVAAATGIGSVALAAVVGGATLGVLPNVDDYGTYNQTNYETRIIHESGQDFKLLTINFNGDIKKGYTPRLVDTENGTLYEVKTDNNKVEIKTPIDEAPSKFRFEIKNEQSNKVVYSKNIEIKEIDFNYSEIILNPIFKTRYIKETEKANLYFYIDTNLSDYHKDCFIDKLYVEGVDPEGNFFEYKTTKIADSIKGNIYKIENYDIETTLLKIYPYINYEGNQIWYDNHTAIESYLYSNIDFYLEAQHLSFGIKDEKLYSDVLIEVINDKDEVTTINISKDELKNNQQFIKFLDTYEQNLKINISFIGECPGNESDTIITDDLMEGSIECPKVKHEEYVNTLDFSYGDFTYKDYTLEHKKVSTAPDVYEKDVTLNFNKKPYNNYYIHVINPKTLEEELVPNQNFILFKNVPLNVHEFTYLIYNKDWTEDTTDDFLVRKEVISIDDQNNYGTLAYKNFVVTRPFGDAFEFEFNFEGYILPQYKATIKRVTDDYEEEITNVNLTPKFTQDIQDRITDFIYEVKNIETDEVLYTQNIEVNVDKFVQIKPLMNDYRTTYNSSTNKQSLYFTLYGETSEFIDDFDLRIMNGEDFSLPPITPTYKKIANDLGYKTYVIEEIPYMDFELFIDPYQIVDGDIFYSTEGGHIKVNNNPDLDTMMDAQLLHFKIRYEDPLEDVSIKLTYDDNSIEEFKIPRMDLFNQTEYKKFVSKFSLQTKMEVSYNAECDSNDLQEHIPSELMTGSEVMKKSIVHNFTYVPDYSYGDIAYDNYEVTYVDTSDPSIKEKNLVIHFKNTLNGHYQLRIVIDPITKEEVTMTTVNLVNLNNLPLDAHDFTVNIYYDNYTSNYELVRTFDINIPDVYPGV